MRRTILTLALAIGMVLGGASVALAHPPGTSNNGQANGFQGDGPLGAFDFANPNGQAGIAENYVVRSPNCLLHDTFH